MIDGKRALGLVPARAGSQGLPGKNLRPLAGRPMIGWTLLAGQASTTLDRLVVTTDDDAIIGLAGDMGVETLRRPAELADAKASVIAAIDHALTAIGEKWDYVVLLQPTSPLRTAADIDGAVALCHDRNAPSVIGVSPMPKPPAFYGSVGADGLWKRNDPATDEAVIINGAVYVGRPDILRRDRSFQSEGTLTWPMPPERGWDVDTLFDFVVCEALWPHVATGEDLGGVRR
ncbi:MAG: acylneuraminate cytidylyltransferase family protein [Caulobacteraceae bacterium]|nr:acylneuraminate cytidylyltransferase family protein [Caulobacteraceae bacterium]